MLQSVKEAAKIKLSYSTQKPAWYIQSYIFNSTVMKVHPIVMIQPRKKWEMDLVHCTAYALFISCWKSLADDSFLTKDLGK